MKKLFLLLPVATLLFACNKVDYQPARNYGDDKLYAFYMYNYPRVSDETVNGYEEKYDNALFLREEIQKDQLLKKPTVDPTRKNYLFQGWFRESKCETEWNFAVDHVKGSTFLYAKWGVNHEEEEYVEPEYVYPERIITDMNYRVTGILNKPLTSDTEVDLPIASINRLKLHKDDVSFAVNYERKADVNLTVATYDEESMIIHLEVSSGETWNIHVNDITATLSVAYASAYYEQKAVAYETNSAEVENYHIALMGSSSMENWKTSTEDMDPIVSFNHGIGGTTVEHWTDKLLERLVMPYSPKAVVYYVGVNNIINQGDNGTVTGNKLNALFDKTHQYLPNAQIFYVLINKLPNYPDKQTEFDICNDMARAYESAHDYLTCIDAGQDLLKEDGTPHWGYFMPDGLHMSKFGYVYWGARVKRAIMDWLG